MSMLNNLLETVGAMNMKSIRNGLAGALLAGGAMLAAGASLSIASAADGATAATPPSGTHGPGHHGFGPWRILSKLNLTTERQASIKAIFVAAKPQLQSLHEQMKANHLKLSQTTPDDPNYANIVAEVAQTNATLASQRTTQSSQIKAQWYAVLTAPQKTQLATLEAQWAANPHQGHWGHRGPQGGAAPATAPAT
jgi:Spy/CpxP family protein refolding chaperone